MWPPRRTRRRPRWSSPTISGGSRRENRSSTVWTCSSATDGAVGGHIRVGRRLKLPARGGDRFGKVAEKHRTLDGPLDQNAAAIRLVAPAPRQAEHAEP